jgi:dihydrofolate reductase
VILSLIVAMDEQRGIGYRGGLPWKLSADLKRFKQLTMGHHIIVGRKTYESIGRPLPGRQTVVITHNPNYGAEGVSVVHSLESAIQIASERAETEAFICGGAEVYSELIGRAGRIYLTQVHARVDSDTFFPDFDLEDWRIQESFDQAADEKNQYPFTFRVLERKSSDSGSLRNKRAISLPIMTKGSELRRRFSVGDRPAGGGNAVRISTLLFTVLP